MAFSLKNKSYIIVLCFIISAITISKFSGNIYISKVYGSTATLLMPEIHTWIKQKDETIQKTILRINEVCQKYRTTEEKANSEDDDLKKKQILWQVNTLLDTKNGLAYCQVPKVGTHTWMSHFKNLLPPGVKNTSIYKRQGIQQEFRVPTDLITGDNFLSSYNRFIEENKIVSFLMVRHPFERIVSLYKSEILRCKEICAKKYGIYDWYKKGHSFRSFIDLVLEEYRNESCYNTISVPCTRKVFNIHWTPYHNFCLLCDISYKAVGRMETFNDDVKYILLKSNATIANENYKYSNVFHSSAKDRNKPLPNKAKKTDTQKYMSQLTQLQVNQLYQMYKVDFEMFQYNASSYLKNNDHLN